MPEEKAGFHKIMVPVSGRDGDKAAIALACQLAKRTRGKVYVAHVIQVKRALPLDAELEPELHKAEQIFSQAEDAADQEDYPIETELLQSREVGPALVEEAVQKEVDLILMSIEYRRRFGEFRLDGSASYVLRNAPCSVYLLRPPHPSKQ